jgi:hypothetical protein
MIVYREQRRRVLTAAVLRRIGEARGFERDMEMGELHAGVADAFCPDCDRDIRNAALPPEIEISVPEGFAYYALDPELYRIAARRFVSELRPSEVAVIGIRSIGTTLGATVEAELRRLGVTTRFATVRPRGHPFDRRLRVDYDLAHCWLGWHGYFAIVDEGPGLSGTSFASVAEFLATLGIRDERVVLFPSWDPGPGAFGSDRARRTWARHRRYFAGFGELHRFDDALDLSGGNWRDVRRIRPAVQPQHERRKYLRGDRLYKFAGYGRYGRARLERAERLAGWIPEVLGLEDGFVITRWVEGRPARRNAALIEHAAKYLAHLAREFRTGEAAGTAALAHMIEVNTGRPWTGLTPEGEAVLLDGRMLRHEWLETANGIVKTDALDHHDDHFFPGPQDIAWDVAAFGVEFGAGDRLAERYAALSGDRGVAARLPFYRAAYLAFRFGYCDMAVGALGESDDADRFRRARRRYERLMRSEGWTTKTGRLSA